MARSRPRYRYSVERRPARPGSVDVALVRRDAPRRVLDHVRHHDRDDTVVLFHRTFRSMFELAALETYAAQLARVAEHANCGTLGCFIETKPERGNVQIALYERWFDGSHLHCEELDRRVFDPADETTLVASAEFLAELEDRAAQRNEARDAAYLDASADDVERTRTSREQEAAAEELTRILPSETGRA
jgi:hypothetical protein